MTIFSLIYRLWLPAYYTQTVVVTCHVPWNIEIGTKNRITFTARGTNSESQSAILTVSPPQTSASRVRKFMANVCTNRFFFLSNRIF